MSTHTLILPLAVLLFAAGCAAPTKQQRAEREAKDEQAQMAWWLKKEFTPTSEQVKGVAVAEFNADWQAAEALTPGYLKRHLKQREYADVKRSQQIFELITSIDGDALQESFVVGVYQQLDGEQGRFLAIMKDGAVEKVFEYPGERGFSALVKEGDSVRWFKCMACDDFDSIRWSGQEYILEPGAGEFVEAGA